MKTLTKRLGIGLGVAALAAMGAIDAQAQDGGTWTRSQTQLAVGTKLEGVTTIGNRAAVIGGRTGANSNGAVQILTVVGGRVTAIQRGANLPGELRDAGKTAQCNGRVYQSGGDENSARARRANETLLLSLDNNPRTISFVRNATDPLRAFGMTENIGSTVFVISGDAGPQGVSRSVAAFDCNSLNLNATGGNRGNLAGAASRQVAQIPVAVVNAASASTTSKIVVTGGRAALNSGPALNTVQVFDGTAWTMGAPMMQARFGHTLVRLNDNEVMAVGGSDGQRVLTSVEIFNIQANQWTAGTDLPMGLVFADGDNAGDNRAIIVGGSRGAGPNDASLTDILEFSRSGGAAAAAPSAAPAVPSAPLPTPLP